MSIWHFPTNQNHFLFFQPHPILLSGIERKQLYRKAYFFQSGFQTINGKKQFCNKSPISMKMVARIP